MKKIEETEVKSEKIKEEAQAKKKEEAYFKDSIRDSIYISYELRAITYTLLALVFLITSALLLTKTFSTKSPELVTYQEKSNIDYKVYLKKNEFYETKYLGKNMIYVASLIKRIDVDFNYVYNIDRQSNIAFDYNIMGKLVITDRDGKNTFFEKEYTLLQTVNENMNGQNDHAIKKQISIDYDYYNNLANKFRANYGIDTNSNLIVTFNIREQGKEYNIKNNNNMSLTIPLSEKAINIKMDYKEINNKSQVSIEKTLNRNNYAYIAISILTISLAVVFSILSIRLILGGRTKKSAYDKYIKKILNEYDRLIVETTTGPDTNHENTIKIDSFEELLDVRDNLNLPIKFHEVHKHQKCNFYINHNDELYLLTIKAVDLEEQEK